MIKGELLINQGAGKGEDLYKRGSASLCEKD